MPSVEYTFRSLSSPCLSVFLKSCSAPDLAVYHQALALRVTWQGHTIAYTGDTEWTETLIEVAQGADLLIAEGYTNQRKIRFHLDVATLEQHAGRLAARRVILTHLSADVLARAEELGWETASDGMTVDLPAVRP